MLIRVDCVFPVGGVLPVQLAELVAVVGRVFGGVSPVFVVISSTMSSAVPNMFFN